MTTDESLVVFLDANVPAKPVTRTLMLRCAASGYTAVWSQAAEKEADRHLTGRRMSVSVLRAAVEIALSPTWEAPERFTRTPVGDRQILADAERAGATFLVTEDVDDFAAPDLRLAGVSAVNPDLFPAELADPNVYRRALEVMASGMSDPSRTRRSFTQQFRDSTRACSDDSQTCSTSSPKRPVIVNPLCSTAG